MPRTSQTTSGSSKNTAGNKGSLSRENQDESMDCANYTSTRHRKSIIPKKFKTELQKLQYLKTSTNLLIPKRPFVRLIRSITTTVAAEMGYSDKLYTLLALVALQESAELYLTQLLQDAYQCTLHRGRVTLSNRDIQLVRFLRGATDVAAPMSR